MAGNNLTQVGAARLVLQCTTSCLVSGAGTAAANGTYTYRGQSGGKAYYNLLGQADSLVANVVKWTGSTWTLGPDFYDNEGEDVAFPWLSAEWQPNAGDSPAPTVTPGTGSGEIVGASGCGMVSANQLIHPGTPTFTVYGAFKGHASGVLLETGTDGTSDGTISISFNANAVICKLLGNTGQQQQKAKTIVDNNWHWFAATGNTGLAAANQLILEIDNSVVGVSSGAAQDLNSQNMGDASASFFCRDAGGTPSNAYPGSGNTIIVNNTADDATVRTSYFARFQYLMSTIGITV